MQAWTFKPLCMHSYSLPLFKIGLLHTNSFTKSNDTESWHWTHSVMKCASIEEPARKDSMPRFKIYTLHNIIPRNSLTSLRALLAEVYTSSSFRRRNSFQVTFSMLGTTLAMEEKDLSWPSSGLHQPCSQVPFRQAQILLDKPRFWQVFVHYFSHFQGSSAVPPRGAMTASDTDDAASVFCAAVLQVGYYSSSSFPHPNNQPWIANPVSYVKFI